MLYHSLNARYNMITPISINIEARITIIISLNNRISKPISIKIIPILKIWSQFKLLLFNINLIILLILEFQF